MANNPCIVPTDTVNLSAPGNPAALRADLRVSSNRGNPLKVFTAASGEQGVDALDFYTSDQGGPGVNDWQALMVTPQAVPVLGVSIVASQNAQPSRAPTVRLPGANGDPLRLGSVEFPEGFATWDLRLGVADSTNPRIDRIVATWLGNDAVQFVVKQGSPTAGATLDNLLGATAIDTTQEARLADVLVDAGANVISSQTKIRDRRNFLPDSGIPGLGHSGLEFVALDPAGFVLSTIHNNKQAAALVRLRRPIRANFLYWPYVQATAGQALSGQFAFALFDASKRLAVQTGTLSFAGTGTDTNVIQRVRTPMTVQNQLLMPGYYYLCLGVTGLSGSGTVGFNGVGFGTQPPTVGPRSPNVLWHRDAGGVTMVQTLDLAAIPFTDAYSDVASVAATNVMPVPAVMLGET